ncbi:predicted protein [Histoplasma capsulatum G186AR]|uniref:Uncharacterized protein n=1 Tax=Ajellomyces capsulatus (strain G186AR / H82 / ATCC MYA-2454 / RMSCC 2432) TaxID=447093 RepID=C0NQA4_AJECG|nr:uncharacterized protein HCBG_05692 [Histoplasma capsulatum G186AR]EEH06376.1 predicted protein [Histoplasma capsulatum G186AR]
MSLSPNPAAKLDVAGMVTGCNPDSSSVTVSIDWFDNRYGGWIISEGREQAHSMVDDALHVPFIIHQNAALVEVSKVQKEGTSKRSWRKKQGQTLLITINADTFLIEVILETIDCIGLL